MRRRSAKVVDTKMKARTNRRKRVRIASDVLCVRRLVDSNVLDVLSEMKDESAQSVHAQEGYKRKRNSRGGQARGSVEKEGERAISSKSTTRRTRKLASDSPPSLCNR